LTFIVPCIVIYSYNKTQRDALISQIYFKNTPLHVSGTFTAHHQECSTVHTAIGICHIGYADCLLAPAPTIHFGRNPRNGGSPPKDNNDVNILNFISVVSLFAIKVRLMKDAPDS
jgi:hypothetical protein